MKRLLLTTLALIMMVGITWAEPAPMSCATDFGGTIEANGSYPGTVIKLKSGRSEGFFCIQPMFTGDGTLLISYQGSNDGETWDPTLTQIVAGAATDIIYRYPAAGVNIFAGYLRLVYTETGTTDTIIMRKAERCIQ